MFLSLVCMGGLLAQLEMKVHSQQCKSIKPTISSYATMHTYWRALPSDVHFPMFFFPCNNTINGSSMRNVISSHLSKLDLDPSHVKKKIMAPISR